MSIKTEINRIITAKNEISAAVLTKGTVIPDDALLHEYPSYISDIRTEAETEPHIIFRGINNGAYTEAETVGMSVVPMNTFNQHGKVEKIIINKGVIALYNKAIYDCDSLKEVVLPDTLKTLIVYCLGYNDLLDNLHLPKSITTVQQNAIFSAAGMKTLTVAEGFNANLPLQQCPNLTLESVSGIITNFKSASGKTLTLHSNVFESVPAEEILRANNKGLNIAQG